MRRDRATQPLEKVQRQTSPRLTVSSGAWTDLARAGQSEKRLNLADHFAASAIRIKHLVKKTEKGPAQRVDLLAAIRSLILLGEQSRRTERAKEKIQMHQALLAEVANALTHRAEAGAPGGKKGRAWHGQVYILATSLT
jgi:hypothetical protein